MTLRDLREDFPRLAPSTVARVLDALVKKNLVRRNGNPAEIYLGGVKFWPAPRTPTLEDKGLDGLIKRIQANWPGPVRPDYERGVAVLTLPLSTIIEFVACRRGALTELAGLVGDFRKLGLIRSFAIDSGLTLAQGEPALQIELGMLRPEECAPS